MTATLNHDRAASMVGPTSTSRRCKVGRLLDNATDTDRAILLDRINAHGPSTGWTDRELSKRLTRAGLLVSASALSIHRNRLCICTADEQDTP